MAVAIKVRRADGVGAPRAEQEEHIEDADGAVAVKIGGALAGGGGGGAEVQIVDRSFQAYWVDQDGRVERLRRD